uniref:Exonuclease domain-containing protein n=1 Tax=Kalanchoe fedtschenkoi TaxID=63787 RepID=A0A7N0T9V1_KALFE
MDKELDAADKLALVEIVKLTQKRGMEGSQGGWKDFLKVYDKQFGNSLSDPSKRSVEALADFVKTFSKEEDIKTFKKVLECHSNRELVAKEPEGESPEQNLVRSTITHPHFSIDYSFPTHEEGWVVTKLRKNPKKQKANEMVAIDCEMVLCEDGTEALVKVCVVDRNLQVKLDELVKPDKPVVDYRTEITGVSANDLEGVSLTLSDVQQSLKRILSRGTILIGHGLNNDLKALKLEHARIIDTAYIFKYADAPIGRKPSLNNVCKFVLGCEVRKPGDPHNCLDDARAAMKIVVAKIERRLDEPIPLVQEDKPSVPGTESAKLFIHKIPVYVTSEDLYRVIPGDHKIEIQQRKSIEWYSALAIFKSLEEADLAFETVSGVSEKDSSGRPQKLVTFKCIADKTCNMYVRKMASDSGVQDSSKKRAARDPEAVANGSKKMKSDHQEDHLREIENLKEQLKLKDQHREDNIKEIENLKKSLSQRDHEISTLHKIIASLTRKQGL